MKAFYVEESMASKGAKRVAIHESVHKHINTPIPGSYGILKARLFGLNYADFMRMMRDVYGADLHGKNGGYITCTFKNASDCKKVVDILNERWKKWIRR